MIVLDWTWIHVQANFCFVKTEVELAGAYNTRITLYRREAATLDAGQLQLSKITTFTDPGASIVRMLLHHMLSIATNTGRG